MAHEKVGIESSLAISEAVKLANVDVIAAYPITPQTHVVESLAEMVANGHLDAEYIPVESEHSAMSACLGSSARCSDVYSHCFAGPGINARGTICCRITSSANSAAGCQQVSFRSPKHMGRSFGRYGN